MCQRALRDCIPVKRGLFLPIPVGLGEHGCTCGAEARASVTARPATPDLNLHGWLHERETPGISGGVQQTQLVQGRPGLTKLQGGQGDELVAQARGWPPVYFLALGTSLEHRDYTLLCIESSTKAFFSFWYSTLIKNEREREVERGWVGRERTRFILRKAPQTEQLFMLQTAGGWSEASGFHRKTQLESSAWS